MVGEPAGTVMGIRLGKSANTTIHASAREETLNQRTRERMRSRL